MLNKILKSKIFVKNLFYFLFFLSVNICFAVDKQEIIVFTSSEDAEGVTQKDFDIPLLKYFENKTVTKLKEKINLSLKNDGLIKSTIEIEPSSVYINIQNTKLAVIKIKVIVNGYVSYQIHIFGIKGNTLMRVACVRQSDEQIPISYGKCNEQINKTYGIDLIKGAN